MNSVLHISTAFAALFEPAFINSLWKHATDAFPGLKDTPSIDLPALLLVLVAVIIAAWLLSRFIAGLFAGPINKMRKIRGGNMKNTAGAEAPDDLGQLFSRVFSTITTNLKTTSSSIESLHKEIAGHKLAEDTLRRAKTDLEKAYRQLQETFEVEKAHASRARSDSAAKSRFIANVSHEIRTPLTGIIGICDLLLETKMSKEQVEYAQIINSSADTLLNIINSTLDLSKIEAGKMELENIDFNLGAVVEDVAGTLAVKAAQKKVEMINFVEPDVPLNLKGDPGRLRQILANLIGNAIKFTSRGEILVQVTLADEKDGRVVLRFAVHDTGIGILDVKKDQLFNAFTQADASIARNFGGTGLGLAIAKGLVKQMDGTIGVESEHGKGSTFWFIIPFLKQRAGPLQAAESRNRVADTKILVVDDNATCRTILSRQLLAWKAKVETAANGKEALAMMRSAAKENNPFSAAIIDQNMPEMDGFSLGQSIKADPQLKNTGLLLMRPMILLRETYDKHKHLFAGMIQKPIRQSGLYNNLLSVLNEEALNASDDKLQEQGRYWRGHRLHILVAEDDTTNQKVISHILEKMGHSASIVANGKEAVKALETINHDLLLMDIQMPEMNGFETTALIRDPKTKVLNHNIPILALTAHAMKSDREQCLAVGMNGYIAKPISMKSMANALASLHFSIGDGAHQDETINQSNLETVFDAKTFSTRMIGDKAPVKEVINTYLSETLGLIRELERAVSGRHKKDAVQLAHNIKGGAATVSADVLRSLAFKIQTACMAANWAEAELLIPELARQFEILEQSMREYLKKAEGDRQ